MGYSEEEIDEIEKRIDDKNPAIPFVVTAVAMTALIAGLEIKGALEAKPEPETPEPTEADKQELLQTGVNGMYRDIDQAVSYGLLSEAQRDELSAAMLTIANDIKPDDLMQALIEEKDKQPDGYPGPAFVYSDYKGVFTEYLSPQLKAFNDMVGRSDNGCLTRFGLPETADDALNYLYAYKPEGVSSVQCENATDITLIGYPADAADVAVSYNFEREVAYFEKTGFYARRNCDDENSCFSTEPFTALEDSAGLAQAFADKAQAEAYIKDAMERAEAYIAEKWPQIEAEMDEAIKPAAPAPR